MTRRKVLMFGSGYGFTIPKEFARAMKIERGNYVEVFLRDRKTLVIKKHMIEPQKITVDD